MMAASALCALAMTSCGGHKNLIVPHSVSNASAIGIQGLNLQKGGYEILAPVSESASVTVEYRGNKMVIKSGEGDFSYTFCFDKKAGWYLDTFQGIAPFGYLMSDITEGDVELPKGEEFARRVAVAKLIDAIKDYSGDGALEPIITTRASNVGNKKVEYSATATAKIVKIKPTTK